MFSQFQAFPILWMLPWAPRVDENSRYEKAKNLLHSLQCSCHFLFSTFSSVFRYMFSVQQRQFKTQVISFESNLCLRNTRHFSVKNNFFCCVCGLKESKNIFLTNIFKLSQQFSSQDGWPSNRVFRRVCPPVYAGSRRKGDESRIGQAFQIMVRANFFWCLNWIL